MKVFEVDLAGLRNPAGDEFGAGALTQHLPGDDIRVMLHFRDQDFIARPDRFGHALRDQIDRLGGAPGKDDLAAVGGADKRTHLLAGALEGGGGFIGHGVCRPVNIGVELLVIIADSLDYLAWFLGGGGVVQVDQRLSVHLAIENGKVAADVELTGTVAVGVACRGPCGYGFGGHARALSPGGSTGAGEPASSKRARNAVRTPSAIGPRMHSARKPIESSRRARGSGNPRLCR